MVINDKKIKVELFKPRNKRQRVLKFTNVYIKHIPDNMEANDLYNLILKEIAPDKKFEEISDSQQFWCHPYGKCACINFKGENRYKLAKLCVEKINGYDISSFIDDNEEKGDEADGDEDENKEISDESIKKTKLFAARSQKRVEREFQPFYNRSHGSKNYENEFKGCNLYIKHLDKSIDDDKLYKMFENYGNIISAKVMLDKSGKTRYFGFVSFETKEEATKAMSKMNGKQHFNKILYVSRAQKKEARKIFLKKQRFRIQQQAYSQQMHQKVALNYNPAIPPFGVQLNNNQFIQTPYIQSINQIIPNQNMEFSRQTYDFPQNQFPIQMTSPLIQQISPNPSQQTSLTQQSQLPTIIPTPQFCPNLSMILALSQQNSQVSSQSSEESTSELEISSIVNNSVSSQELQELSESEESTSEISEISSILSQESDSFRESEVDIVPFEQKRLIGEELYPKIQEIQPRLAEKLTKMLMEMQNDELLDLLQNKEKLINKVNEASNMLKESKKKHTST